MAPPVSKGDAEAPMMAAALAFFRLRAFIMLPCRLVPAADKFRHAAIIGELAAVASMLPTLSTSQVIMTCSLIASPLRHDLSEGFAS